MPTITVEIPGKGTAEFPEGTDELAILHAIRASFPDLDMPAPPSERVSVPPPGQAERLRGGTIAPGPTQAFPTAEARVAETGPVPEMSAAEAEQLAMTPQLRIPRMGREGSALRGVENVLEAPIEFATAPAAPFIATAQLIPGVREAVNATLAAGMVKQGAQELGEASVTGNREQAVTGAGAVLLGGVGGAGTAAGILLPKAKLTFDALVPESHQLPAPRIRMPEFTGSTYEEGATRYTPTIPAERQLPAPGMPEFTRSTLEPGGPPLRALPAPGEASGDVLLPGSPLGPRTAGYHIQLPVEPETAARARQVWSKPIDIEAQVTGADALRQLVSMTDEQKTAGQPYQPPSVNVDLRQLERMMQRNTVSKVESWADETIQGKLREASANPYFDPEFLAAAATKGAILFKRGVVGFAQWADEMRKQFGPGIEERLRPIYDQTTRFYEDRQKKSGAGLEPAPVETKGPNAIGIESTAALHEDVLRGGQGGAPTSEVPEDVGRTAQGLRQDEGQGAAGAGAEAKVAPARDWDAFYEDLTGDLDSFAPARESGRRSYEMDDVAERFVAFAKQDKTGRPMEELVGEFAKGDEASAGQIRKLRASVKNVEVARAPANHPTAANTGLDPAVLRSSPVTTPSAPETRPLGFTAPSSLGFLANWLAPFKRAATEMKGELSWKAFAQETLPEWTRAKREVGEAGARYAAAPMVGETLGRKFARDVMGERAGDATFDRQLGTALKEDNLRSIRKGYQDKAEEARAQAAANPNAAEAFTEDAALYDEAARSVVTLVGGRNSPFRDEAAYRAFLNAPETQAAIERYRQLWAEQKEPMFREAADIDPDTELPGRGLETGARINLTFQREGETAAGRTVSGRTVGAGGAQVRQLGTLRRRDPFLRQATGTGTSYHASLSDTMADAFRREYPVAKQRDFIRQALEAGVVEVGTKGRAPEGYQSYLLTFNPWRDKYLYVPKKLVPEYEALVGLRPGARIPGITPLASVLTHQSIMGLGEGTAHSANILLKLATGVTTSHPWLEAMASALPGRPDFLLATARALFHGLRNESDAMLELAKINAAKRPYSGVISSRFLNPLDQGVRVLARDTFRSLADSGIVKDTETNLREFVNEVGNYTQSVQSPLVRNLRSMQVQPFATGFRTAKVQVVKRLGLAPGLEATSAMNAVALRAAVLGKFIGSALTIATINYLLSGHARGYQGTPLGSISWQDKEGKVHYWDAGAFLGATSGLKATGIAQAIEAKERNLDTSTAGKQASRAIGTTLTSQFAGPSVRFATVAISGKDPYGNQIADVSPPTNDPLRAQAVKNIQAALQGVNPIADFAIGIHEGKTMEELRQRQITRYSTRTPSTLATSDKFTEVVTKKNLMEYADWLATRARKLDLEKRGEFIRKRLADDKVTGPSYKEVTTELKRKGVYRYR